MTFAKSLDPGQAQQNVKPDWDQNYLTLLVLQKDLFFKKKNVKKTTGDKNADKFTPHANS